LKGHIRRDHVHLLLSVPPTLSPSRVMNAIKGQSSNRLMRDFRTLNERFGDATCGREATSARRAETSRTRLSPAT
jgi:REP element-mobilizing transposase RayT